ncbi:dolichyl-phosphate-mannose--protein mannosyltransferase [Marisediminicola senii]|uniref:dolichyl-phosphate-mannose--protein mannosyltransferase n=1 Tax=Marisediminicola senii TaxID=2711233 RepID=UPI001F4805C6|nr:phospholipid carrier-dependent glycosyltransferase [Marisediminicola senii]
MTTAPDFDQVVGGPAPASRRAARATGPGAAASTASGATPAATTSAGATPARAGTATPAATTPATATGSRLDRWWARVLSTPLRQRIWAWAGPIAVTLLAAVLRIVDLGRPSSLVFDETYYVKDAWSMLTLGYEGQWPDGADASFIAGATDVFTSEGAYIAHPPLGKWIISLGMQAFGAGDPFAWRISTAIVGVLAVALVCAIAFALFRSTILSTIAGFLMAIDGLAVVMSRTALLDNSLMFLTLLGFGAVLLDRQQSAGRLAEWVERRRAAGRSTDLGPALWWRPWLITAGLLFGLATAVKWSGLYFLAFFAIYTLLVDAAARRRAGVLFWASSTAVRQAPVSFLLMVPIAIAAYLATWTGWLRTDGGYDRSWAADQVATGVTPTPGWLPAALQSLWHYHQSIYATNLAQETPHGYQADALSWPLLLRPTAFFYRSSVEGENGCGFGTCAEFVTALPNPLIWWLAVGATLFLLARFILRREWQIGLILAGVAAGYLPWLLYLDRTVFQFYTIVFLPYLILALTAVIGLVLGRPTDTEWRRVAGIRTVAIGLALIVIVATYFWSMWTGLQVSGPFQQLRYWLPGWR